MFVGDAVLPLLMDRAPSLSAGALRVEFVVSEVLDERDYESLLSHLRACDFSQSSEIPTRWSDAQTGFELFVTPYDRSGNFCSWHRAAFEERVFLLDDVPLVSAPYFLAIGLDQEGSLSSLLQLIEGRSDIVELLRDAREPLRAFVGAKLRTLTYDPASLNIALSRAFASFPDNEARAIRVREQIGAIIRLTEECDPALLLGALLSSSTPPAARPSIPSGAKVFARSKSVRFAHYDRERSVMTIGFVEGRVYRYFAVPQKVFDALCDAERPGRYINEAIRDRFPYEQVGS